VTPRPVDQDVGAPGLVARGAAANDVKDAWRKTTPYHDLEPFLEKSKANQAEAGAHGQAIADTVGADFGNPGVKAPTQAEVDALPAGSEARAKGEVKLARLLRKITNDDGEVVKHPGTVTDQVRMGFKVAHPADGDTIVRGLAAHHEVIDEGWFVNSAGYFDRKVYVRFKDGMIGEVQIWEPSLLEAKEHGGGHDLYVAYDKAMRAGDTAKAAELERQMQDLYGSVMAKLPEHWRADPELGPAIQAWEAKASAGRAGKAPNLDLNAAGDSGRASMNGAPDLTRDQAPSLNAQNSPGNPITGTPSQSKYLNSAISTSDGIISNSNGAVNRAADHATDHLEAGPPATFAPNSRQSVILNWAATHGHYPRADSRIPDMRSEDRWVHVTQADLDGIPGAAERPYPRAIEPTPDMTAHAERMVDSGVTPSLAQAAAKRDGDFLGDVGAATAHPQRHRRRRPEARGRADRGRIARPDHLQPGRL
jgi:hypothetical protein